MPTRPFQIGDLVEHTARGSRIAGRIEKILGDGMSRSLVLRVGPDETRTVYGVLDRNTRRISDLEYVSTAGADERAEREQTETMLRIWLSGTDHLVAVYVKFPEPGNHQRHALCVGVEQARRHVAGRSMPVVYQPNDEWRRAVSLGVAYSTEDAIRLFYPGV